MILPLEAETSFSSFFKRSSNSPRYLAPAMSPAISRDSTDLPRSVSGTSLLTIRCARPSTTAVLPTPGSPISTGLFFVRRCRICIVRRISSSRPITGSSFPMRARSVRSTVYFLMASRPLSPSASSTFSPPRTCAIAASSILRVTPAEPKSLEVSSVVSVKASKNISEEMNSSPWAIASFSVRFKARPRSRLT